MRAPSPNAVIRLHQIPPAGTVQAATAWRATVRAERRTYAARIALCVAILAGWVAL